MPASPKPAKADRTRAKARAKRAEQKVIDAVRAKVLERDGCRMHQFEPERCFGRATWAHCEGHRRYQTLRQSPDERHQEATSIGLCVRHADDEERHRLRTEYLTERLALGRMAFIRAGIRYEERKCLECDGAGEVLDAPGFGHGRAYWETCQECLGTGRASG